LAPQPAPPLGCCGLVVPSPPPGPPAPPPGPSGQQHGIREAHEAHHAAPPSRPLCLLDTPHIPLFGTRPVFPHIHFFTHFLVPSNNQILFYFEYTDWGTDYFGMIGVRGGGWRRLISALVVAFAVAFIWIQSMGTVAAHAQGSAFRVRGDLHQRWEGGRKGGEGWGGGVSPPMGGILPQWDPSRLMAVFLVVPGRGFDQNPTVFKQLKIVGEGSLTPPHAAGLPCGLGAGRAAAEGRAEPLRVHPTRAPPPPPLREASWWWWCYEGGGLLF